MREELWCICMKGVGERFAFHERTHFPRYEDPNLVEIREKHLFYLVVVKYLRTTLDVGRRRISVLSYEKNVCLPSRTSYPVAIPNWHHNILHWHQIGALGAGENTASPGVWTREDPAGDACVGEKKRESSSRLR